MGGPDGAGRLSDVGQSGNDPEQVAIFCCQIKSSLDYYGRGSFFVMDSQYFA